MSQKRFPWSEEEDRRLVETVECMQTHDERGGWKSVPRLAGLNRSGKSCSLRWNSYLKPGIKKGHFSEKEVATIMRLQSSVHRNKWATIAAELPGRTNTDIKNLWNTHLKKKEKNLPNKETPPVLVQELVATVPVAGVSSEPSVVNQILEIGEITPSDQVANPSWLDELLWDKDPSIVNQEIANPSSSTSTTFEAWPGLVWDNETSDFFCGDISLQ